MSGPSDNPAAQGLQTLLFGTGFNFYSARNQMRADDLLVRQRASGALAGAAQSVAALEQEFRRRFIPAATRDAPFPPADAMEKLRGLGRLRTRLLDLEAQINGMPVPTQDKVWWRFRDEATLLHTLLGHDYALVQQTETVHQQAQTLTADAWNQHAGDDDLERALKEVEKTIRERRQFLQMPTPYG